MRQEYTWTITSLHSFFTKTCATKLQVEIHMSSLSEYNSQVYCTCVNMVIKVGGKQTSCSEFWFLIISVDCFQNIQSFFMNLGEGFFSLQSCLWGFGWLSDFTGVWLFSIKPMIRFKFYINISCIDPASVFVFIAFPIDFIFRLSRSLFESDL